MTATPLTSVTSEQQRNAVSQGFNQSISSADLTSSPAFNITDPKVGTSYAGVSAGAINQASQFVADKEQQAKDQATKTAEANATGAKQTFFEKLLTRKTEAGVSSEQYATEGVDVNKQELNDINNRILASEQAQKNELRALETAAGTIEGKSQAQAAINRKYAFEQSDLAVIQLAKQGKYDSAKEVADRKVDAILEEDRNILEAYKFNYEDNKELFTKKEQRQYEENIKKADREYAKKEASLKTNADIALDFLRNGGDSATAQRIANSATISEALGLAGSKLVSQDTQLVKLDNGTSLLINSKTGDVLKTYGAGTGTTVSGIVANQESLKDLPTLQKNNVVLTQILQDQKIGQGTRTQTANSLGVINAVQDLASAHQTGGFGGISPFNVALDVKIPFTDKNLIPGRNAAMTNEGIQNRQYLEAINLKVQQWASGASLTKQQTEQVEKLTPRPTDTDDNLRVKMNGLVNFMLTQVKSQLQSEGKTFEPVKVDLFETQTLLNKASPEQLQQFKEAGLLK